MDRLNIDPGDVSVVVKGSGVSVDIRNISYEAEPHFYHIHLGRNLDRDVDYQIRFNKFNGSLSTDGQGLFINSYKDGDQTM